MTESTKRRASALAVLVVEIQSSCPLSLVNKLYSWFLDVGHSSEQKSFD